jgi:acylphosphatase
MSAIRAFVPGRGDGFRDEVLARASELGLLGWVRTDEDGVRVHAEGDAVHELRAFLGPDVEEQPAKVEGHEQLAVRGAAAGRFVVEQSGGRYALRLEVDGAMRTWTLAKAPSMDPKTRRMAIEADAPAAGDVWDEGLYEQGGRVPWPEALDRGHAVFVLHGSKLRGGFALQRTRDPQWLLVKRRDEHARAG